MADQSNEMVERVARAMMLADGYEPECWPYQAALYLKLARAAIEAMRTPTAAMSAAMSEVAWGDAQSTRWAAGIDAALSHDEVKG